MHPNICHPTHPQEQPNKKSLSEKPINLPTEYFYQTQVYLGSDLWVRVSLNHRPCADLTDVNLADEDTNSTLAVNANRVIQGNVAMQVAQPGRKISK